jgi:hypothetical protein
MVTLAEAKEQIEDLKAQVESVQLGYRDLREIEMSIIRISSSLEKMTGSKEVQRAINSLNRLIMTIRMTQIAFTTLEATTPIGWLYAMATWLGLVVMVGETTLEMTS